LAISQQQSLNKNTDKYGWFFQSGQKVAPAAIKVTLIIKDSIKKTRTSQGHASLFSQSI
jgi:hypothetical protein